MRKMRSQSVNFTIQRIDNGIRFEINQNEIEYSRS